jgi:hypothetical protein
LSITKLSDISFEQSRADAATSATSVTTGSLTTKCRVVSGFFQQTSQIRKIHSIVEKEKIDVNDKLRSVCKEANVGRSFSGRNDESQEIRSSRDRWKEGGSVHLRTLLVSNIIHHTWQINYVSIRSNGGISLAEGN